MQNAVAQSEQGTIVRLGYRPDIDGLRAVAVLAVVCFHAFPNVAGGGFVGVDIFFVISGFLISTIIVSGLEQRHFSIVEFYSRRVRRIFPALAVVLAAVLAFGWFGLSAEEYKNVAKHVLGGAGFASNILLWRESGYFDTAAESKPLLHLWSLGVEEQFYIAFPWLLWAAALTRWDVVWPIAVVGLTSFTANIAIHNSDTVAAFYSPWTRAWELMLGAALACVALRHDRWLKTHRTVMSVVSAFGLASIGWAMLATRAAGFPGWTALWPTVGAALLIAAGPDAQVNRFLLSRRWLVWIGVISFPLYLWHWAVLSLLRIEVGATPHVRARLLALAAAGLLAALTHWFVERPLRRAPPGVFLVTVLGGLMAAIGLSGYLTFELNGLPGRTTQVRLAVGDLGSDTFFAYLQHRFFPCEPSLIRTKLTFKGTTRCFQSRPGMAHDIAIVGDSHAEHLFPGLANELSSSNVIYLIADSLPYSRNEQFRPILDYVTASPDLITVIFSAYWAPRLGDLQKSVDPREELSRTVQEVERAGKRAYFVSDVPDFSFDPRTCKYGNAFSRTGTCAESGQRFYAQNASVYLLFEAVRQTHPHVALTIADKYFCRQGVCSMAMNGTLLFRDIHHLNVDGSNYLAAQMVRDHPELQAHRAAFTVGGQRVER